MEGCEGKNGQDFFKILKYLGKKHLEAADVTRNDLLIKCNLGEREKMVQAAKRWDKNRQVSNEMEKKKP